VTKDGALLTDCQKIHDYIKSVRAGKVNIHFESATIPKSDGNLKRLAGVDYDNFMTKSNMGQSKLVLITHENESKNRGIEKQFARFAQKEEKMLSSKSTPTIPTVYCG